MYVLKSDRTLFVDVDDTLIIWDVANATYRPNEKVIETMRKFYKRSQPIVVWSAGGYEWAEKIVNELNLADIVTAVMCKPAWFCDDLAGDEILHEANRIDPRFIK